jgi:two-component system, OmpR family, phosphate regulon sensor histidine kinase PhoR
MKIILSLTNADGYLQMPASASAWIGWSLAVIILLGLLWASRRVNKPLRQKKILLFIALLILAPLTSLFFGFRLPPGSLPPPEMVVDPKGPMVMILSAIPWLLAGGLLGPLPSTAIALLSGLSLAFFETHNLFTPLQISLLAVLFSLAVMQRYRTVTYRSLRDPLVSALLITGLFAFIWVFFTTLNEQGMLAVRLDYALSSLWGQTFAFGIQVLLAAFIAEAFFRLLPSAWGGSGLLIPSPGERSLQARFLYGLAPMAFILVILMIVGDWYVAGNAAREMLKARMADAAGVAAQNVPYFLDTGENLIADFAKDPGLGDGTSEDRASLLEQNLHNVPFFQQLILLDINGNVLASYPQAPYLSSQASLEEQTSIQLALTGFPVQSYAIPPASKDNLSAQISFVAPVKNSTGLVVGALIGRTDLVTNPLVKPVITSLDNMAGEDGQGFLLDENNRILYHQDKSLLMEPFAFDASKQAQFSEGTAPDGTRRLIFTQQAVSRPWMIVLTIPAHRAQQMALSIAFPLLAIIFILVVVAVIILRLGLRMITGSLQTLAVEAGRIAQGQLNNPMPVGGEDEVGDLRRAFEKMRVSLKARLDELNRLLTVSQGVASSLEMTGAAKPVLEAALSFGAGLSRVVLAPAVVPEWDSDSPTPTNFSLGLAKDLYHDLDDQILQLARQQDRWIFSSPTRPRLLNFKPGNPRPEAIFAVALRHENQYYGALWVAYDQPHPFTDEEIRFLATLAGQAALAAANARLFLNTEIGRQRLAAILASTPDPVLVTDQNDHLLLANPAAWQVLGLGMESEEGQPIERVILQKPLVNLLRSNSVETQGEITLPNGRVYLATASSVMTEGQRLGRVCVLRDVTHFMELDALKSEFVATVSHDLRSPLTLMRGYATMLEMVGELNDQQANYVSKIVTGVESMSRLVTNLLDLGRIEAGIGLQVDMVHVQDVIERVVSALQLEANQKNIQIKMDISEDTSPLIEADQALLQQAIHNLVENAIKYTPAQGKVSIRMWPKQDRMVIEVRDTGSGISPMDQPRLFEKFYRGAQQTSKEQRGTGLGLAIVKSIAERHGGQVWVESQLGKGSAFFLAIPLHQATPEAAKP